MSDGYEIVRYRPEHLPLVAALQKQLWSTDERLNARYLEWKYGSRGDGDSPLIYLALHEGRPIGMRGFHEARLEAGTPSRAVPMLIAGDALISGPHRNRGLVARIMHMAHADLAGSAYPYVASLGGASRVNTLGLLTMGWKSAGAMGPVGRLTPRAISGRRLRDRMARMPVLWRLADARFLASMDERHPFRHLDAALSRPGSGNGTPVTIERQPRIEAMAGLVERLGHDGRIRYVRDREYLAWRFANPISDYRFLYREEAGRVDGYLALSRRASDLGGWSRVYIADLEATDIGTRSALLDAAMSLGRFPELVTWTASLPDADIRLLEGRGFAPVDPEDTARGCPCILVRSLRDGVPHEQWLMGSRRLLDISSWDIRLLYSMRG